MWAFRFAASLRQALRRNQLPAHRFRSCRAGRSGQHGCPGIPQRGQLGHRFANAKGFLLDIALGKPPVQVEVNLAQMLGRDTRTFKLDVRKLKALGLTISLETGYRLSPRGEAFLARVGSEATE